MLFRCPACERRFGESGFCPFDRTPLVAAATPDQVTMLSVAMAAVRDLAVDPRAPAPDDTADRDRITADRLGRAPRRVEEDYDRLVGQTLDGKYLVTEKIGEGGMGVVFAARHAVIERPLAIKVLRLEVMREEGTARRFVQEAKAASRVGHPNIVDVTDFGTTPDGMTYSVMEYVSGETLGATLRAQGPMAVLRALRIAAQIARALAAAHAKGVIHRDLKPENVFLTERDGRADYVKIVDFGIARVLPQAGSTNAPRLTKAGALFGTPEYMAPEQAAGRIDIDPRVDIYALGVILYEMLCGEVPHRGETSALTLSMVVVDPVIPPSRRRPDLEIPAELESVVMTALAKDRDARFASMTLLLEALERLLVVVGRNVSGSPIHALAPRPHSASSDPDSVVELVTRSSHDRATAETAAPISVPARRPRTPSKALHEPEFVAAREPGARTFPPSLGDDPGARPRRAWPILLALAAIGATAGAVFVAYRSTTSARVAPTRIAVVEDGGIDDAGVVVDLDAAIPELVDAAAPIVPPPDASVRIRMPRRDAGDVTPDPGPLYVGTVAVQVLTRPEGATLYVGNSYRGVSGTTLAEAAGSTLNVRCAMPGYKDGTTKVVFDGKSQAVMCVLTRIKVCIDNIKNVFDDCEVAPTAKAPPSAPTPPRR